MIDFGDTVTRIEPTIDEIARVAYARDLLRGVHDERGGGPVRRLLRPAHFVPETNASHELLAEMQVGHFNLAIVVDDHGAIAGLVTLQDLMEDSSGRSPTSPTSRNPSSGPTATAPARVSGRIRIDELKALLGIDLAAGDRDTAADLQCALHGHVPGAGETATCRGHTLRTKRVWAPA